jgi:hypothetical protein
MKLVFGMILVLLMAATALACPVIIECPDNQIKESIDCNKDLEQYRKSLEPTGLTQIKQSYACVYDLIQIKQSYTDVIELPCHKSSHEFIVRPVQIKESYAVSHQMTQIKKSYFCSQ